MSAGHRRISRTYLAVTQGRAVAQRAATGNLYTGLTPNNASLRTCHLTLHARSVVLAFGTLISMSEGYI